MESTFGERLKKLRKAKGMSQEALAALLGTSKQVISRYESNQRIPKLTTAAEYAQKLNVPLDLLIDSQSNDGLSEKEAEFIKLYRLIPEEKRAIYETMLEAILKSQ